jgi:hypothetical protein
MQTSPPAYPSDAAPVLARGEWRRQGRMSGRRHLIGQRNGSARRLSLFAATTATATAALLLLSLLLSACGPDARQAAAEQNRVALDHELRHARVDLGIPDAMLQPIISQEQKVAAGDGGWNYNYADAASNYSLLYSQLVGIEQTAGQTLRAQAIQDTDAFTKALNTRRDEGFSEIAAYQARLDQAIADFDNAHTPGDFYRVDAFVRTQTVALNALWPAYLKLQDFTSTLRAMHTAGVNSSLGQAEYTADLQAFRDASDADRYQKLTAVIDGQIMQMMADETEAMPYIGSAMLDAFQARIDNLKRWGENAAPFQRQHDEDASALAGAHTLADYLTLAQLVNRQTAAMELPLVRGNARNDLHVLQGLINGAQAGAPTTAYEYANGAEGIGLVRTEFDSAHDLAGYQQADNDTVILITNLRALLDDLHDPTPAWQAHRTDLSLLQQYGIFSGRVAVISLREQTARFYQNGNLVYWSYVTTGRPERPSPPGLHYALDKEYHTEFISGDPPGSPYWFAPTPVNYAILYANNGFFLHDAWWRYKFGPGTNLPHWDPLAFNGGSHGCINFPEDNMPWVYNWISVGTPVIVY